MHDGFGTIENGYFVPHSHVVTVCACGRLLLMPVGATDSSEAIAIGSTPPESALARLCCP